jgi:hypothetical protein
MLPLSVCTGDVPDGVTAVAVHWEKGSKVSYTEPAHVDPDGTAVFAQVMRRVRLLCMSPSTVEIKGEAVFGNNDKDRAACR